MSIVKNVPLKVQNLSGEDLSHHSYLTAKCGTLVPALVQPVLPNTRVKLRVGSQHQLPPMATDFYGTLRMKYEAFFVPYRILYGGWRQFITSRSPFVSQSGSSGGTSVSMSRALPQLKISNQFLGPGSLADYLGYKIGSDYMYTGSDSQSDFVIRNSLPFLAYHMIWDSWYRDSRLQKSAFPDGVTFGAGSDATFGDLPWRFLSLPDPDDAVVLSGVQLSCGDDVSAFSLRQRNWARDYFTSGTVRPQQGDPVQVSILGSSVGSQYFNMQQLFAANAVQRWSQVNNVAGERYSDQILAHFGTLPPDAVMDRPVYLGRAECVVYTKGVYKSNDDPTNAASLTGNPFTSVASKYGSSMGVLPLDAGTLIDDFTAKEHGFVFVMQSLVPDVIYSTGIRRYLDDSVYSDFPFPELATMGDEVIRASEINGKPWDGSSDFDLSAGSFNYNERFASYKSHPDELHGILRDGQSLEAFAMQRSLDAGDASVNQFGSQFLEIPTGYLDQVTAVSGDASKYGYWSDNYFDFRVSQPLPAWSQPTLTDPSDVHTVSIPNGGRML